MPRELTPEELAAFDAAPGLTQEQLAAFDAIPSPGLEGAASTQAKPDTSMPGYLEANARAFAEGYTGGLSGRIAGVYGAAEEVGKRLGALTYADGVPKREDVPLGYAFDEARQKAEARRWTSDQAYPSTAVTEAVGGYLNPVAAVIGRAAPVMAGLQKVTGGSLQVPRAGLQSMAKNAAILADNTVVPGAVAGGLTSYGKGELEDVPNGMKWGGGLSLGLVGGMKGAGAVIDATRTGVARISPEASRSVANWLRQRAINRYKKGAGAIQQDLAIDPEARVREDRLTGLLLDANEAQPGDTPAELLPKFQEMAKREGAAQGALERSTDDAMAGRVGLESGDINAIRAERTARRTAAREASQDALLTQKTRLELAFQSARRGLEGDLQELETKHGELVQQLEESVAAANASGEAYSGQLQAEQAALRQQLAAVEEAARQRVQQLKQVAAQQQEALAKEVSSGNTTSEDLKRIAELPARERRKALAQQAQQMADLEVPQPPTDGIQPEVLQLMGAGKREQAAGIQKLAEGRVAKPAALEPDLEAVRGLAPDKQRAVLEDIARRRLAAQEGVDPALAPVVGKASKEQKPAIEAALNQRIMYPEPKAPPVPTDDVLLHNVGLDVEPVIERLNDMLADYRSHDDRGNAAYILNTIRTLRQNARKGMTAAELRAWKTSITENINYARDVNKTQAMKKQIAGIYDEAVESAVEGQLGPEKLAEYQKTKDAFGAAAMATNWATRGVRRDLGNRAISPSDYAVGLMAGAAGNGASWWEKLAHTAAGTALNRTLRKHSMTSAIYSDRLSKYLQAGADAGPASSAMFNEYGWFLRDLSRATPASAAVGYYLMHTRDQKFREMDEEAQREISGHSP